MVHFTDSRRKKRGEKTTAHNDKKTKKNVKSVDSFCSDCVPLSGDLPVGFRYVQSFFFMLRAHDQIADRYGAWALGHSFRVCVSHSECVFLIRLLSVPHFLSLTAVSVSSLSVLPRTKIKVLCVENKAEKLMFSF